MLHSSHDWCELSLNSEHCLYPGSDQYVRLTDGLCHYRLDGPIDGETILLIHGATVPAWEFDRLVPYLVDAGYRILRADLYGHGYSDRPAVRYDLALFVRQWFELLDALGVSGNIHIVGHSLGAAIGAALVAEQPLRFSSLVLAAPLVDFLGKRLHFRLLNLPAVGEWLMRIYVLPMLVRRRTRRYQPIEDGRFVQKFHNQLLKPGFEQALLSLFRHGALGNHIDTYRGLSGYAGRILILRGEGDVIVSRKQVELIRQLLGNAPYEEVAGTAHAFILTHPEKVFASLNDFYCDLSRAA